MSAGEEELEPEPVVSPEEARKANGDAPSAKVEGDGESEDAAPTPLPPTPLMEALAKAAAAQQALDAANARLREVSKAYTELNADNKAFRERMEHRAKLDSSLQAFEQVRGFFDPVMNLKRCLANPGEDLPALLEGLGMVQAQFMDVLHRLGLAEVPGVGAPFDPNVHEALGVAPVTDPEQDGKVLVVHTLGYAVKGKVLQAAQVVIGKYEEAAAGEA